MKRWSGRAATRVALATVAVTLLFASTALAGSSTTTPGQVYIVKVRLTATAIVIPKDKFSIGHKYPRYPRGAEIQYQFRNTTSKPLRMRMWDKTTPVIPPGRTEPLLLNWNFRGKYDYATLRGSKPAGPHGVVTIF
jgi:hypothetical protein